jgi:hypothetical protein
VCSDVAHCPNFRYGRPLALDHQEVAIHSCMLTWVWRELFEGLRAHGLPSRRDCNSSKQQTETRLASNKAAQPRRRTPLEHMCIGTFLRQRLPLKIVLRAQVFADI